jgi:squalene-associated FAD-dependent desaturase
VTLVERRPFLGGRAFSFTDREGRELDNGQHVFLGCCPAYQRLMHQLGTDRFLFRQPLMRIPVSIAGGRPYPLAASRGLPSPLHLAGTLARYPHLSPGERARVVRAIGLLQAMGARRRARLDRIPFSDWLTEQGQSPAAVERFWDLVVLPTCNDRSDRVSAAQAAFVFTEGMLSSTTASAVGWSRVPLGQLVEPSAERLLAARGSRVLRGTAVAEAGPGGVRLADGEELEADGVVLALPPERVRRVASAALADDPELGHSPIVNVHLFHDRPVLEEPFQAVLESPLQWIFDRRRITATPGPPHVAISISGAHAELGVPRGELAHAMAEELERAVPSASGARLVDWAVVKEARATFSAAPGQAARRPGARTPLERVALAGTWTATGWPATMEGAVRSGIRAAREVMGDLPPGAPRPAPAA